MLHPRDLSRYNGYLYKGKLCRFNGERKPWNWKKFWFDQVYEFQYSGEGGKVFTLTEQEVKTEVVRT